MKLRFFAIPATAPDAVQEEVNQFCATHRVVSLEKHLIPDGDRSYWALCISYLETAPSQPSARLSRKDKIDYREVLNEHDFALFARLRSLRKTLAERDGIPAYALFTNEQLAAMIQQRVTSKAAMSAIDGVGTARIDKYGDAFLQLLLSKSPLPVETPSVSPRAAAP